MRRALGGARLVVVICITMMTVITTQHVSVCSMRVSVQRSVSPVPRPAPRRPPPACPKKTKIMYIYTVLE